VKFQNKDGQLEYVWQTSWGVSTRLIGGVIMTHSDDNGLVLPPKLAPLQAVLVPFYRKKEDENQRVKEACARLERALKDAGVSAFFDAGEEHSSSTKKYKYEREGVPLRFEIGPKDLEQGTSVMKRRDLEEKENVALDQIPEIAKKQLADMQVALLERAKKFRETNTVRLDEYDDFRALMDKENKFVLAHWDGTKETEAKVKQETQATIRCIPLEGQGFEAEPGQCMVTGKPSKQRVIWAKAY
jgi:prolyl-tRNA synthetase